MSTKQYYLAYINDAFEKLAKSDFEIFRQSGLDPYSGAPMKYPETKDTSKILSRAVASASKGSSGGAQRGQARGGSYLDIMKGGGGISSTPRKPEGRYQKTLKRVWEHPNPVKDAVFPGAKVKLNSALRKIAQGGHPLTLQASSYGAYKLPKGSNGQPDTTGKPIKVKSSWIHKAQSGALSAAAKTIKPPTPPSQVRGGSYLTMLSKAGSVDAVKTANLALLGRGLKAAVRSGATGLRQIPQAAGKGLQEGFKRGRTGIKAPVTTWGNRGATFAARAGRNYGRMGGMAARLVNSKPAIAAAGGVLGWEAKKAWDKNRLTDRLKAAKGAFLKSPKAKGGLGGKTGKTTPSGGTMPYREYYPTPQINRQNLTPRTKEGLKNDRWSI